MPAEENGKLLPTSPPSPVASSTSRFFRYNVRTEACLAKGIRRSCFISAPYGVDTSVIRRELQAHKVEWFDITTIPVGLTFVDAIRSAIEQADFLCVVVPASATGRWTLLEAGIAIGAGKPLLFIVDRDAAIPSDLAGFHYALAKASDAEAIRFHLDNFLLTLEKKPTVSEAMSNKRSAVTKRRTTRLFHLAAESDVARLFERAGFLLHEAPHRKAMRYEIDLAVWIDDLLPIFSSPILPVEFKRVSNNRVRLMTAEKLRRFLLETGAGVGLLVELGNQDEVGGRMWQAIGPPPFVFAVSIAELQRVLERGEFVRQLIDARNRAVHGA